MAKKLTNEEFIKRAVEKHGSKYDYSKTKYTRTRDKIIVICPIHDEFEQLATIHLRAGCPQCGLINQSINGSKTNEEFIKRAVEKHGSKYDYSKTKYTRSNKKVIIICKKHGEFEQLPSNHEEGQGCHKCSVIENTEKKRKTNEEFIIECLFKHDSKYDYSKTEYIKNSEKIIIICPVHGEFEQVPLSHLKGFGCKKCSDEMRKKSPLEFYIKNKEIGLKHGIIYQIRIFNETESFYKIGITKNNIKTRYGSRLLKAGYNYDIIDNIIISNIRSAIIENEIHKKEKNKYKPKNWFGGWNECYKNKIDLKNYIKE